MNLPIDIPSGGPGIIVDLFAGGGGASEGLPRDCFRCCSCGKLWRRCHGKPERSYSGMVLPGSITVKEVQPRTVQKQRVAGLPGV